MTTNQPAPAESACQHECAEPQDSLIVEIARELYDCFVMGGWEPQDAYPQIRRWVRELQGRLDSQK